MIKHTLKDKIVSISIENIDFSYRIPTKKMGNTTDWRIGEKETEGILVKNVSTWTLHLFTKETTEDKYIKEFKSIVQEYAPSNTINWEETQLALNLQNEYNLMIKTNATVEKKMNEDEIVSILKKKYTLD
jgi:hypothetical protein